MSSNNGQNNQQPSQSDSQAAQQHARLDFQNGRFINFVHMFKKTKKPVYKPFDPKNNN